MIKVKSMVYDICADTQDNLNNLRNRISEKESRLFN